jgi:uncharacterized membrane protein
MARDHEGDHRACQICGASGRKAQLVSAELVREPLVQVIRKTFPDWSSEGYICLPDLNRFRSEYVESLLETEKGELSSLEQEVVESLHKPELLADNIFEEYEKGLTLGQRLADHIADFGGSWVFILIFVGVMVIWMIVNSVALLWKPFDPYPYILLNLLLSTLAAIQAPIIMMSQNRQEERDRLRAQNDYQVNLKAELEIRYLHEKIDHLMLAQWERLAEIQKVQLDLMNELTRRSGVGKV